jgi:hypothetical protein
MTDLSNSTTRCAAALAIALAMTIGLPISWAASARAQTVDPKACAQQGQPRGDLSDKLSQTNGVICPPDVDPDMKAPTPNTGKMPVVPPPGSPGGNPNVQPK